MLTQNLEIEFRMKLNSLSDGKVNVCRIAVSLLPFWIADVISLMPPKVEKSRVGEVLGKFLE